MNIFMLRSNRLSLQTYKTTRLNYKTAVKQSQITNYEILQIILSVWLPLNRHGLNIMFIRQWGLLDQTHIRRGSRI